MPFLLFGFVFVVSAVVLVVSLVGLARLPADQPHLRRRRRSRLSLRRLLGDSDEFLRSRTRPSAWADPRRG
jgi:uncharacterized protein YfiM (DUF2279 family)